MFGCASMKSQFFILFVDARLLMNFCSDIIINTVKTICLSAQLLSMNSSMFPIIFIIVLQAGLPGHFQCNLSSKSSPSRNLDKRVLHLAYLDQLESWFDLAQELAEVGIRPQGMLSWNEYIINSCESSPHLMFGRCAYIHDRWRYYPMSTPPKGVPPRWQYVSYNCWLSARNCPRKSKHYPCLPSQKYASVGEILNCTWWWQH